MNKALGPEELRATGGSVLGPAPAESPGAEQRTPDLLWSCLQRIAVLFGMPTSKTVLLAGLPVEGDELSLELFIRAAEQAGLRTEWRSGHFYELSDADVPALAWRADSRPLVIEKLNGAGATAFLPEHARVEIIEAAATATLSERFLTLAPSLSEGVREPDHHWFWRVARPFWPTYLQIGLAAAFINVLALAAPLFTMNVYDRVLPNKAVSTLWVLSAGVLVAFVFDFLLRVIRSSLIAHVTRRLDLRVASMLVERVLNTRLSQQIGSTGAVTQRLNEYDFVREFLGSSSLVFCIDLVFGALFLGVIASISPSMAVFPALAILCMISVGFIVQRLIGLQLARANFTSAHRQSLLVELVSGRETIKSLRAEGLMLRKWDTITREASYSHERVKAYSAFASNFAYLMQLSVTVFSIVLGAYLFESGDITTGGIIAVTMLASRAVSPMGQIALTLSRLRQALTSLKTLSELMRLPDERADQRTRVARVVRLGRVEFKDVSFAYGDGRREVLKGLSFRVEPGERVALLGKVGAGKTTVGRLLIGLHHVTSGDLLIDGVDLRHYHPHELRRAISFVGNEADLFQGSLRENLLIAKPDATDEELLDAARSSGIEDLIGAHPLGFELPVGERGSLLSSGQRQMVALARAFLARGKILFLDDPTSSMDLATERLFVQRLTASLTPEITLIFTTHRNAMLALANRLVVIDHGKVVADGPKELILRRLSETQASPG